MESVLEAKQATLSQMQHPESGNIASSPDGISHALDVASTCRLVDSHSNLQQAIMKYELVVERLEQVCRHKIEAVSREDVDAVLMSLDTELLQQKANLLQRPVSVSFYHQREPRFVLDKSNVSTKREMPRETSHFIDTWSGSRSSSVDEVSVVTRDIDTEITSLQRVVDELQTDIELMTRGFSAEMINASQRLHCAVCIPPLRGVHTA
jgi:hypothetical protein